MTVGFAPRLQARVQEVINHSCSRKNEGLPVQLDDRPLHMLMHPFHPHKSIFFRSTLIQNLPFLAENQDHILQESSTMNSVLPSSLQQLHRPVTAVCSESDSIETSYHPVRMSISAPMYEYMNRSAPIDAGKSRRKDAEVMESIQQFGPIRLSKNLPIHRWRYILDHIAAALVLGVSCNGCDGYKPWQLVLVATDATV